MNKFWRGIRKCAEVVAAYADRKIVSDISRAECPYCGACDEDDENCRHRVFTFDKMRPSREVLRCWNCEGHSLWTDSGFADLRVCAQERVPVPSAYVITVTRSEHASFAWDVKIVAPPNSQRRGVDVVEGALYPAGSGYAESIRDVYNHMKALFGIYDYSESGLTPNRPVLGLGISWTILHKSDFLEAAQKIGEREHV